MRFPHNNNNYIFSMSNDITAGLRWGNIVAYGKGESVEAFLLKADIGSVILDMDASAIKNALFGAMAKFEKFPVLQHRALQLLQDCHMLTPGGVGITDIELEQRFDVLLRTLSSWMSKSEIVICVFELLAMVADRDTMKERCSSTANTELLQYMGRALEIHQRSKEVQRAGMMLYEAILHHASESSKKVFAEMMFRAVLDNLLLNNDDPFICYSSFSILFTLSESVSKSLIFPYSDQLIDLTLTTIGHLFSSSIVEKCLEFLEQLTEDPETLPAVAGHERGLWIFVDSLSLLSPEQIPAAIISLEIMLKVISDDDALLITLENVDKRGDSRVQYLVDVETDLRGKCDKYLTWIAESPIALEDDIIKFWIELSELILGRLVELPLKKEHNDAAAKVAANMLAAGHMNGQKGGHNIATAAAVEAMPTEKLSNAAYPTANVDGGRHAKTITTAVVEAPNEITVGANESSDDERIHHNDLMKDPSKESFYDLGTTQSTPQQENDAGSQQQRSGWGFWMWDTTGTANTPIKTPDMADKPSVRVDSNITTPRKTGNGNRAQLRRHSTAGSVEPNAMSQLRRSPRKKDRSFMLSNPYQDALRRRESKIKQSSGAGAKLANTAMSLNRSASLPLASFSPARSKDEMEFSTPNIMTDNRNRGANSTGGRPLYIPAARVPRSGPPPKQSERTMALLIKEAKKGANHVKETTNNENEVISVDGGKASCRKKSYTGIIVPKSFTADYNSNGNVQEIDRLKKEVYQLRQALKSVVQVQQVLIQQMTSMALASHSELPPILKAYPEVISDLMNATKECSQDDSDNWLQRSTSNVFEKSQSADPILQPLKESSADINKSTDTGHNSGAETVSDMHCSSDDSGMAKFCNDDDVPTLISGRDRDSGRNKHSISLPVVENRKSSENNLPTTETKNPSPKQNDMNNTTESDDAHCISIANRTGSLELDTEHLESPVANNALKKIESFASRSSSGKHSPSPSIRIPKLDLHSLSKG